MSLIFTPAQKPPKLDKFCYMSHPAQRVMSALYQDYLTRKRNLLQCLTSPAPAQENYYQSIYKSRFGSVPKETHGESTLDVPKNTFTSGEPSIMGTTYSGDEISITEEPTDNQSKLCISKTITDGQFSRLTLTGSSTAIYDCLSDSPPIETQGYRILSQYHLDKTTSPTFGEDSTDAQGSQSLFSQDRERSVMPKVPHYIKRESKKVQHTREILKDLDKAEHLLSCRTMIEKCCKPVPDKTISTSGEQKSTNLTSNTIKNFGDSCHGNISLELKYSVAGINSSGAEDDTCSSIYFRQAAKSDTKHRLERINMNIPSHLEKLENLALSTVPQEDNVMLRDRDEPHVLSVDGKLSEGTENYYIARKCASKVYPDIMDIGKMHTYSSDKRSGKLQEKSGSPKKRKPSAAFAAPFKKLKLPPSSRPENFQDKKLIDTESLSLGDLREILSEVLKVEEVVIVLIYKDGSTQLRDRLLGQTSKKKGISKGKQNGVEVETLAIFSHFFHEWNVCTIPVKAKDQNYDTYREFWCQLLKSPVRKLGFQAKEILTVIMRVYKLDFSKVDTAWTIMDPLIGLWLLDPDKAVTEFEAMLHFMGLPEQSFLLLEE